MSSGVGFNALHNSLGLIPLRASSPATELKPWMFDYYPVANQSWPSHRDSYNQSLIGSTASSFTFNTTMIPGFTNNSTKSGGKKSKGGSTTPVSVGHQDQNAIRRGFNGTETGSNSGSGGGGRNKEGGRQRNNRKQINSGVGGQNSDESLSPSEWGMSSERNSANYTEPEYYLGKLIDGTYCSRVFKDCDKLACRIQSPNYPGVYPRNLTCFYAVRQVRLPVCQL